MTEQNYEQMRRAMVASQLRTTGVNDPRVLAAMGVVPRERFMPAERRAAAYADTLVPLDDGRFLNSPMALGKLLTEAAPQRGEKALVVGAASGYAAAVLAELVGSVTAVEEHPTLVSWAKQALVATAVKLVEGPLTKGHKRGAPYDLILIDGAVELVPDGLADQLAEEGRLVTGIIDRGVQRLAIGRRAGGSLSLAAFADVACAPLPGFAKPRVFSF